MNKKGVIEDKEAKRKGEVTQRFNEVLIALKCNRERDFIQAYNGFYEESPLDSGLWSNVRNGKKEMTKKLSKFFEVKGIDPKFLTLESNDMFLPATRNTETDKTNWHGLQDYLLNIPRVKKKKEETIDIAHKDVTDEDIDLIKRLKALENEVGQRGINLMVVRHDDDIKKIKALLKIK